MKGGVLIRALILVVSMYVFLKFILPLFTAPLPASLIFLYLMLTLSGILIFATLSGESSEAFWGPIFRFLSGDRQDGAMKIARLAVLLLFPLLVGWQTYNSTALSDQPPGENRTIHPAPPGEFVGLSNPFSPTPENIAYGKGRYLCSAFRATAILTAKGRLLRDSIHLRRIFPIRRPSPCFRRAISSGASKGRGGIIDRRYALEIGHAAMET